MKKYVYSFGGGTADGDGKMRDVLGGKGAGLAEMSKAGVPVPPGFTISTEVCNLFFENNNKVPKEVDEQIQEALEKLEEGDGEEAWAEWTIRLLLSVRSGAKFSMPGMMNTILNLGLNDKTTEGLAKKTGNRAVCVRLLSPIYSDVRRSIAAHRHGEVRSHFRLAQSQGQSKTRHRPFSRRPEGDHRGLQKAGKERNGQGFPAGCPCSSY